MGSSESDGNGFDLPNGYISISTGKGPALAVKTDHGVYDVAKVAEFMKTYLPPTVDAMIQNGESDKVRDAVSAYIAGGQVAALLDEQGISFAPCVHRPEKIICVGTNYRDHAREIGAPIPPFPLLFNKFNNALLGHGGVLQLPRADAEQFDYEVELVMVVGKVTRDVDENKAFDSIFGYCVGNDVTARDLQTRSSQIMLGKISDGFAPIGPVLVPAHQVSNPDDLAIECFVNGERRQSSRTHQMIFSCAHLVSYLSRYLTLKPGDLIFTGTPGGPVAGKPEKDRVWLKAGDEVVSRIEALGTLSFTLG